MDQFDKCFKTVKPTIYKFMRFYYIHLWEKDD